MKKIFSTLLANTLVLVTLSTQIGHVNVNATSTTLIPLDNFAVTLPFNYTGSVDNYFDSKNVDVVAPGLPYNFNTANVVDLNGLVKGEITSKTLDYKSGDRLTLSFDYGGNFYGDGDPKSATVSVGSNSFPISATANKGETPAFKSFKQTFDSTSYTPLIFSAVNEGNGGILITNVLLTKEVPTTILDDNFSICNPTKVVFTPDKVDTNFNVPIGSVDCIEVGGYGFSSMYNTIDLNGNETGEIKSNLLEFTPGDTLTLSFDYGANPDGGPAVKTAIVSLGGESIEIKATVNSENENERGKGNLQPFTKTFKAGSGPKLLDFASNIRGAYGVLIANVKLTKLSPIVVTPATPTATGGASITIIGNNNVLSSSSISSVVSSSSSSSLFSQSERKGVLGFTTTTQEQGLSSVKAIDPSKTTILVSSQLKEVINSAKGGTIRTGGVNN